LKIRERGRESKNNEGGKKTEKESQNIQKESHNRNQGNYKKFKKQIPMSQMVQLRSIL
jgi:hypothetical protein